MLQFLFRQSDLAITVYTYLNILPFSIYIPLNSSYLASFYNSHTAQLLVPRLFLQFIYRSIPRPSPLFTIYIPLNSSSLTSFYNLHTAQLPVPHFFLQFTYRSTPRPYFYNLILTINHSGLPPVRFMLWQRGILEALYDLNNYPNNRVLHDAEDCLSVPVDKIRSW